MPEASNNPSGASDNSLAEARHSQASSGRRLRLGSNKHWKKHDPGAVNLKLL
jgi:hypothetical protein